MPHALLVPAPGLLALEAAWVGPVGAISLVVIALAFVVIAVAVALMGRAVASAIQALQKEIVEGRAVVTRLQHEVEEVIRTSQRVRGDLDRGLRRARHRLADLDALAEVMQEEVTDTALDVASRVRSFRTGTSVIGRLRRLFLRGRR